MGKVVGIDLGTTNSVVAAIEGGQPTVITTTDGFRTTPSIIAYTKKQELLVGQIAKRQAVINPENTFFSIKRFIGSNIFEIDKTLQELPYKLVSDQKNNIKIPCPALNKEFSPEEISAQILRKLINDAEKFLGQDVSQAVITVPAYFNDSQRQATIDAGKIAGLDILRIINEPTAASLAYGLDKRLLEKILVFDLGGGTFDVSILEVGEGIFEVLSTAGDTSLGGDDFDKVLVKWILDEFLKDEKIDLRNDPQALQRISETAEKTKIQLSSSEVAEIHIPFIAADVNGPKHIKKELTRQNFEKLCEDLIERCRIPVSHALRDADIERTEIDQVVLVGGSTRMPAIRDLVTKMTKTQINDSVNPDEVVAIGAAIQAGILAGEVKDVLLLDVTPLSLGIETLGGIMTNIISRNTTIPVNKSEYFSTAVDNQSNVEIHVLQGERQLVNGNKSLGNFRLDGIPEAQKGVPKIKVTFDLNSDGVLNVRAKEEKTGVEQSVSIRNASTLDQEEIEQMLKDAKDYEVVDGEKRKFVQLQIEADRLCTEIKSLIPSLNLEKEKENQIEDLISAVKKEIDSESYSKLKSALDNLKSIMEEFQSSTNSSTK